MHRPLELVKPRCSGGVEHASQLEGSGSDIVRHKIWFRAADCDRATIFDLYAFAHVQNATELHIVYRERYLTSGNMHNTID